MLGYSFTQISGTLADKPHMKFLVMVALATSQVFAADKCHLYEITGRVKFADKRMELVMAEKTQSERHFHVAIDVQNTLAPYLDHMVKGTFVLGKDKILSASNLKDSFSDPLNAGGPTTIKSLKEVSCPE